MTKVEIPDIEREYYFKNPLKYMDLKTFLYKYTGIVNAKVIVPKIDLGYLGIKYKKYYIFPKEEGMKIVGTWTMLELRKAYELGYKIEEINECVIYPKLKLDLFDTYMNWMYKLRIENKELNQSIKLLMNTLHGKFGTKAEAKIWKIDTRDKYNEYISNGYVVSGLVDNKYYYTKKDDEYNPSYANVLLSALIVAKARDIMYDEYIKIPKEDRLYTDIDSIIFKGNHINKFIIGKGFGEFKIVHQGVKAYIRKEKLYTIGEEVKSSGLGENIINNENIKDKDTFITRKMITLPTAIKLGNLDLIGNFQEEKFSINEKTKLLLELPPIIYEEE